MQQTRNFMRHRIESSFSRQGFLTLLGARLLSVAPGEVSLAVTLRPEFSQQHGAGHAGISFTLGDVAAGYAALTLMEPGVEVMTSEMKIHLLRPAVGEELVAKGFVLKAGRRLIVTRADVFARRGPDEVLIATLLGTMVPVAPELS
ncbi:PaaI family thioesterase [Falsigemmobacter intermedius]|nr:PaaI family thioesterase [Falsigemmobacter intermedius]